VPRGWKMKRQLIGNIYIPGEKVGNKCVILSYDDDRWLSFVTAHPDATIFHHHAWMELVAEYYCYRPFIIAVLDSSGEISAGLPMMDVSNAFRRSRCVSLPFSDYCNPLYHDAEALEQLTAGIVSMYSQGAYKQIELRWEFPSHEGMHTCSDYVMHTIALDADAELTAKRFDRVHRQNIRAAEQNGVRVIQSDKKEDLRLFYQLQLETRHRKGTPVQPRRFFDMLAERLFKKGLGFTLLAYRGDECIAGMVVLGWKQSLFAKYAASKEDTLNLRPNNLLFRDAIRWGCDNNYRVFDMGRSEIENTGLRRYKRGWGAKEIPLNYSVLSTTPGRPSGSNFVNKLAGSVIKHSPVWICRLSGELLYRYLG
jgi:CelD/BcsL family acetyltransferase involved in cellulose biosynthesis